MRNNYDEKKSTRGIITLIVIVVLAIGLIFIFSKNEKDLYRLPVFETSDVHGYIAEKKDDNYQYYLAYISDKVKDVRGYGDKYDKNLALLVDGGDIFQGYALSNLLEGESISAAYMMMGYDAVGLGNHEFDWEIENTVDKDGTMMDATVKFKVENDIPVLASNLYQNEKKVEWIKDYVIVNKKARNNKGEEITVKIALIGYLDEYHEQIMSTLFTDKGYSIKEDISIPEEIAKKLEEEGLADISIILCHADAELVANELSKDTKVDLVLGGHTHLNKNGKAKNGIPYMEPTNNGKAYNYLELIFDNDNNGKVIYKKVDNMNNISILDIVDKTLNKEENKDELDSEIVELTDKVIDMLKEVQEKKVGYITTSAKKKEFITGSGNLSTTGGNWMSSIYQRATNSDVAFTNRGGVRFDFDVSGKKRDVTVGEIYSTYPFDNFIYKYKITYEELLSIIKYALSDSEKKAIVSIIGIDCYYKDGKVNALVKDNTVIYKDGKWTSDWKDKTLTIATNEYVATNNEANNPDGNPITKWNDTDKLLEHDKIDSSYAIEILTKEGKDNNGLLTIDTRAHFIEGEYK